MSKEDWRASSLTNMFYMLNGSLFSVSLKWNTGKLKNNSNFGKMLSQKIKLLRPQMIYSAYSLNILQYKRKTKFLYILHIGQISLSWGIQLFNWFSVIIHFDRRYAVFLLSFSSFPVYNDGLRAIIFHFHEIKIFSGDD